jgi:hypothetical protein
MRGRPPQPRLQRIWFSASPTVMRNREPTSTFLDAGVTAMLGSVIGMDRWGDGRVVV